MKSKDQSGSEDISTEERMYALPYSIGQNFLRI